MHRENRKKLKWRVSEREDVIHRDLVLRMEQGRGCVGAAGIREGHLGRPRSICFWFVFFFLIEKL